MQLRVERRLARLQQVIRQFVVHHDGVESSAECGKVLQERGLSVHFLIDNDGTIYQALDLADCAFHAAGANGASIGVELCNRGEWREDPNYYRKLGQAREHAPEFKVHDHPYSMWNFTLAQYDAMAALAKACARLFPNLPATYPQDGKRALIRTALQSPEGYSGYLGHYHVTQQKWDPGCFDFRYVLDKVKSRPSWFFCPPGESDPQLAEDLTQAQEQAERLLRKNRDDAMGGYFPVGPCGSAQVFHGGLHFSLGSREGTPLFAPITGRVVAARLAPLSPIGSCSFVLTRHTVKLRGRDVTFFVLLFHLAASSHTVDWAQALGRVRSAEHALLLRGQTVFPDIDVSSGELLGFVGEAGPPNAWEPQVHIEVMAAEEVAAAIDKDAFRQHNAGPSSLFCSERELLGPLGSWRRAEGGASALRTFLTQDPTSSELRRLAVRFRSEWGDSADYESQLMAHPEFRRLRGYRSIFREQIHPTLWLTAEVAQRVGLPKDFVVWHYHPIEFLLWLRKHLQAAVAAAPLPASDIAATDGYKGGGDDSYLNEEDRILQQQNDALEFEDLAAGWPE